MAWPLMVMGVTLRGKKKPCHTALHSSQINGGLCDIVLEILSYTVPQVIRHCWKHDVVFLMGTRHRWHQHRTTLCADENGWISKRDSRCRHLNLMLFESNATRLVYLYIDFVLHVHVRVCVCVCVRSEKRHQLELEARDAVVKGALSASRLCDDQDHSSVPVGGTP